MINYFCTT